jgi:hypothetical protein
VPIPSQPSAAPQPPKFDETTLLRRIAEGDAAALGGLFDQMARPVYSLAAQVLRNHDRAEDVVESTFWRAWEESAHLGNEADVQLWLLSTAKSRLLEQSPQSAGELAELEAAMMESAGRIPEHPMNPGRAAGIRSRLVSRASADTDYRPVSVPTTPASRVKPASSGKTTTASSPAVPEAPSRQKAGGASNGMLGVVAGVATLIAAGAVVQMLRANSEANSLRATIQVQADTSQAQSNAAAPAVDQDKIVSAVTGPDVRVISLTHYGARGAVGKMFWNRETNTWTLVTYSIRQPKPDRVFQVWLSTAKGTLPAGTFTPDATGRALVQSINQVGRDELYSISVTEEPKEGAPAPTGPAVIAGAP